MGAQLPFRSDLDGFAVLGALLAHPAPMIRVMAVRLLMHGVHALEHRVVLDAHGSGLTWAEIGDEYGVSRQAVHRRFAKGA